jgi:imidazolonepropionase-like amidohydrolase
MKVTFKDFNLLDVKSGQILASRYMVVEEGRVKEITASPLRGETVSLRGRFVLPGLIDSHVHLVWEGQPDPNRYTVMENVPTTSFRAARSAWRNLSQGVTTVRDVGGPSGIPIALARAIENGAVAGSRVLAAGAPIAQTGGHVYTMSREADGPDEVRKAVREQIKAGAHLIKLMGSGGAYTEGETIHATQLTPEEIRAAVEEAAIAERRVAIHALPERAIQNGLEAGVATIEHAALLSDRNIESFKAKGAFMVPTLAPYYIMATRGKERGVPEYAVIKSKQVMEHYPSSIRKALSSGVRMAMGTDSGSPDLPHPTLPYEAWLWAEVVGIDPLTALRSATVGSAAALGREFEIGLLQPGYYADFVVYDQDPLQNLSALHFPKAVYKGGQRVAGAGVVWSNTLIRERR